MFWERNRKQQIDSQGQLVKVDYWLPITKINVTGTVVKAVAAHGDDAEGKAKSKATPAVVSVVTRPDYSHLYTLCVPADRWAEQHAKLGLLPDGRLASADTSTQDEHAAGLKSAVSLAAVGAGLGGAFGPVGAVVGATAGLVAGVAVSEVSPGGGGGGLRSYLKAEALPAGAQANAAPEPDDEVKKILSIKPGYWKDDPDGARLLADLRIGETKGRLALAEAARDGNPVGAIGPLELLSRRLKLIRDELARSEAVYQKWLDTHVTTTSTAYDEELEITALPSTEDAQKWLEKSTEQDGGSFAVACARPGNCRHL